MMARQAARDRVAAWRVQAGVTRPTPAGSLLI
jgi:hypothetical protein